MEASKLSEEAEGLEQPDLLRSQSEAKQRVQAKCEHHT